jgi:uncharacterized membrane protein YbaN (DUF454 family)
MTNRKKPGWIVAGWLFLAAAVVGVFLPIIPQVPFAIVAAYFFSKGSPRLHRWVLNNEHFGAAVRDWELDRVIRPRLKLFSIAMMIGGAALAYWKFREDEPAYAIGVPIAFALASVFVATRRSRSRARSGSGTEVRLPATP